MIKKAALLLSTLLLAGCGIPAEPVNSSQVSSEQPVSSVVSSSKVESSKDPISISVKSSSEEPISSSEDPSSGIGIYTTFVDLYPWVKDVSLETVSGVKITEGYQSPYFPYETLEIYSTDSVLVATYYCAILDIPLTRTYELFDDNTYQIVTFLMSNGEELSITFFNGGYIRVGESSYYLDLFRIDLLNIEFDVSDWLDFDGLFDWVDELFGEEETSTPTSSCNRK